MVWYLLITIAGGLVGICCMIYYMRRGQFDDPEDPKYQMFRNEDSSETGG